MARSFSVVTWNVNSIRARLDHLCRWVDENRPDALCLQETKVQDEDFPLEPLADLGYQVAFCGQKTYNGVAILSPHPIESVRMGFTGANDDPQQRLIAATINGVRVVNTYVPQGGEADSEKFAYKLGFLADLKKYFEEFHTPTEPLVWVGDFNIAPDPADVFSVEEMEGVPGFHPLEHKALDTLKNWGFTDRFRTFETGEEHFSWWDYRGGSFRRNRGLRIDHIWATAPLAETKGTCWIDKEERSKEKPSDHAPVVATFRLQT